MCVCVLVIATTNKKRKENYRTEWFSNRGRADNGNRFGDKFPFPLKCAHNKDATMMMIAKNYHKHLT